MQTRIQKWGNSLAVRIPKALAEETLLKEDSTVDLTVEAGVLCVTPRRRKITLRSLLDGITKDNLHHEVSTGDRMGNEAW
jgi:antitoxin MazE